MSKAIEASALRQALSAGRQALDGLDLSVEEGTIFALLGPNGAGKSTTVKILTTLTRPDSGQARVAGHDVLARPERVRRAIGVVGQKHGFDPEATGRENLVLQGAIYDLPGRELARADRRSCSSASTSPRAAGRAGQDLLGRDAAAARHRDGPHPPARTCSSSTSRRPGSTPRRASTSGGRSRGSRPTSG